MDRVVEALVAERFRREGRAMPGCREPVHPDWPERAAEAGDDYMVVVGRIDWSRALLSAEGLWLKDHPNATLTQLTELAPYLVRALLAQNR
jgi:hypothetical protein